MIDLHTHILAGLDDGSPNKETSLAMAEMALQDGITQLVATPHAGKKDSFDIDKDTILRAVNDLNELLQGHGIDITILPGAEYYLKPNLVRQGSADDFMTINSSNYILIELPAGFIPDYTSKVVYELQLLGLTPIIAHPERNTVLVRNPGLLKKYCNRGCLSQVTSSCLMGLFGRQARKTAWRFIQAGLVHVIASDAHSTNGRAPLLKAAAIEVERRLGSQLARSLVKDNPERIIEGLPVKPVEQATVGRWKRFQSSLIPLLTKNGSNIYSPIR